MSEVAWWRLDGEDLIVQVKVKPRSSRNAVVGVLGGRLQVAITAAPTDGKANLHLLKFLAQSWGVPFRSLQILRGGHSPIKTVIVASWWGGEQRLQAWLVQQTEKLDRSR